jgi:purine nucleoside phosphorylase
MWIVISYNSYGGRNATLEPMLFVFHSQIIENMQINKMYVFEDNFSSTKYKPGSVSL